jgi:hypothetical protein
MAAKWCLRYVANSRTAAPNSLFASLRWHLCRVRNQSAGACLVNATLSKKPKALDFRTMSCNSVTYAKHIGLLLLAAALAGCAWTGGNDGLSYTADRGTENQPYPANYRPELLAFLRTYLNDPRSVRDLVIAEPVQRKIGGRLRYVTCLRYSSRTADGAYAAPKERAAMYVDGRLDRMIEEVEEICAGATYAAYPDMDKLTR